MEDVFNNSDDDIVRGRSKKIIRDILDLLKIFMNGLVPLTTPANDTSSISTTDATTQSNI